MITGNKGEWSELYVLLRLLADGKIYTADADLNKVEQAYSPVLSIYRQETDAGELEYRLADKTNDVTIFWNGDRIKDVASKRLAAYADAFYEGIVSGNKSSFSISGAETIMKDIRCTKIKASSSDKTDITMQVYDRKTGYRSRVGYSIKSELGNAPSLLNASGATNFRYEIVGLSDEEMKQINSIKTKAKLRDRITEIDDKSSLQYDCALNETFAGNLMVLDSMMDDIIAQMLIEYYKNGCVTCADIATAVEESDPLGYKREGIYRYKIKKFLCAVALGMMPSKKWDGQDEANGGYIIVKDSGEVLAYHLYNRNAFENYLLNNTRFETASSSRHKFGTIYKENGRMYINLNLQVRFV